MLNLDDTMMEVINMSQEQEERRKKESCLLLGRNRKQPLNDPPQAVSGQNQQLPDSAAQPFLKLYEFASLSVSKSNLSLITRNHPRGFRSTDSTVCVLIFC